MWSRSCQEKGCLDEPKCKFLRREKVKVSSFTLCRAPRKWHNARDMVSCPGLLRITGALFCIWSQTCLPTVCFFDQRQRWPKVKKKLISEILKAGCLRTLTIQSSGKLVWSRGGEMEASFPRHFPKFPWSLTYGAQSRSRPAEGNLGKFTKFIQSWNGFQDPPWGFQNILFGYLLFLFFPYLSSFLLSASCFLPPSWSCLVQNACPTDLPISSQRLTCCPSMPEEGQFSSGQVQDCVNWVLNMFLVIIFWPFYAKQVCGNLNREMLNS